MLHQITAPARAAAGLNPGADAQFSEPPNVGQRSKNKINYMKTRPLVLFAAASLAALTGVAQTFRPPAVPLVTFDPYLSIWSDADRLTERNTKHWTKHEHSLVSLIRVD